MVVKSVSMVALIILGAISLVRVNAWFACSANSASLSTATNVVGPVAVVAVEEEFVGAVLVLVLMSVGTLVESGAIIECVHAIVAAAVGFVVVVDFVVSASGPTFSIALKPFPRWTVFLALSDTFQITRAAFILFVGPAATVNVFGPVAVALVDGEQKSFGAVLILILMSMCALIECIALILDGIDPVGTAGFLNHTYNNDIGNSISWDIRILVNYSSLRCS